ncbi:MAG: AAA family ATPase [Acidimicrobiia bacterium]
MAYSQPHVEGDRLTYSTFTNLLVNGRIADARILDVDSYAVGTYVRTDGAERRYNTPFLKDSRQGIVDAIVGAGVPVTIDQQNGKRAVSLASMLLPALIVAILFLYLTLSYRRGTGLFNVRSGARRHREDSVDVTFADVAGQDAAVAELRELTAALAEPERFAALGATAPKGVLLYGPPGCGKTLLARALAGEARASFFSISGSDFVELYQGVGAARVRDLFREARAHAPAIVFVDELDAIGTSRAERGGLATSSEQDQALNQLLAELDGFSSREGIVVLAASNRPDVLDPALLRPGRFDRTIGLERPGEEARLAILRLHARHRPLAPDADLADVARRAVGLTGADLAGLANEAAFAAARSGRTAVAAADLDAALQRVLEAPARQRRLSLRERSVGRRFSGGGDDGKVTFADVAGVDDALAELAEVRDCLADPERFRRIGARTPRGVLLSGPPGCGKTLMARAVAGEANAAFFSVSGSEFVSMLAGAGAARVRDLFAEARSMAPAIVFVDEIDAIGGRRSAGSLELNPERDQTLNQLLVELDGFEPDSGVVVMAATNRPDLLDPALTRPGRFDRQVGVTFPDRAGRRAILALHARDKVLGADVDLDGVAAQTQGFSGADLANVLNEAALLAARRGQEAADRTAVEDAIDRTLLGVASRGTVLSAEERRMVAVHEAGHALVALALRGPAALHKLTIVPQGGTLGHCRLADSGDSDRHLLPRSRLLDDLAIGLGGRAAEQVVLGEPASGASGDLRRVGELARAMVRDLGMSDAVGPLGFPAAGSGDPAWAPSEHTRRLVDAEARALAAEAEERARSILASSRAALERVAEALGERETLAAADVVALAGAVPLAGRRAVAASDGRPVPRDEMG